MSGYAAAIMDDQGLLGPNMAVLAKPFSAAGLLAAVRSTIDSVRTTAAH